MGNGHTNGGIELNVRINFGAEGWTISGVSQPAGTGTASSTPRKVFWSGACSEQGGTWSSSGSSSTRSWRSRRRARQRRHQGQEAAPQSQPDLVNLGEQDEEQQVLEFDIEHVQDSPASAIQQNKGTQAAQTCGGGLALGADGVRVRGNHVHARRVRGRW